MDGKKRNLNCFYRWSDCIGPDRGSCHLGILSTILRHFTHNENPVTRCCSQMSLYTAGCILQAKLTSLNTQPPPGSPRVTILSASPVRTLVHCVVKHSRPPDLKSSSNVSLPFAWITGPRKRTQRWSSIEFFLTCFFPQTRFCVKQCTF